MLKIGKHKVEFLQHGMDLKPNFAATVTIVRKILPNKERLDRGPNLRSFRHHQYSGRAESLSTARPVRTIVHREFGR